MWVLPEWVFLWACSRDYWHGVQGCLWQSCEEEVLGRSHSDAVQEHGGASQGVGLDFFPRTVKDY